ncbi:TolB family protein [Mycobacterium camsae]|uniref:TolB family protein n=1 Tax=Mycobacterium gordonae TaxID=1778 RepID=UPI001981F6BF|nr:PD40 domain-containing protein [Mycobacterium gordonae]
MIAYALGKGSASAMHIISVDGSGDHVPTPVGQIADLPAFSADGQRLAYVAGEPKQVFVTHDNLGNAQQLTKDAPTEAHPSKRLVAFSPDSRRIAYVDSRLAGNTIFVVDAAGGTPKQLVGPLKGRPPFPSVRVVFAPDGQAVVYDAFVKESNGRNEFETNAVRTGATETLRLPVPDNAVGRTEDFRGVPAQLQYSRDGSKIVYQLSVRSCSALFIADANFSNPRKLVELADTGGGYIAPSFSPDGSQIAYAETLFDIGGQAIFVVNADGSGQHQVTKPKAGEYDISPSWGYAARRN